MTPKTLRVLTSSRPSLSYFVFTVFLFVIIIPLFVQCLQFSSRYNNKDLTHKIGKIKKHQNSYINTNKNNVPSKMIVSSSLNKTDIGTLKKYLNNAYNYIKNDHAFVETRKDVPPDLSELNNIFNQHNIDFPHDKMWTKKVSDCVEIKGLVDCLKIFLLRRVDRVNEMVSQSTENEHVSIVFDDLIAEIQNDFQWEEYINVDDADLDYLMCQKIQALVEKKGLQLVLRSGVIVDIQPHTNGTVLMNILKDTDVEQTRGMKLKKYAYKVVPILLLPSLIFAALLPFILPALKMLVLGAGILNQVALMGAIFTLIRNNIFNDKYETKVIYVNDGYKNEYHDEYHPGYKKKNSKRKYPSLTTPRFDEFYEESQKYSQFNDEFGRPVIDADGEFYNPEYAYHSGGRYPIREDYKRKETEEFATLPTPAPLKRSSKNVYHVRLRPATHHYYYYNK